MSRMMTRVPLTAKEGGAIMWGLAQIVDYPDRELLSSTDPLRILIEEGFPREDIMETGNAMFEMAYGDWLSDPLTPLQKSILRVCVENTTWIGAYLDDMPSHVGEARATLVSLAHKLEAFDIYVNFIPHD